MYKLVVNYSSNNEFVFEGTCKEIFIDVINYIDEELFFNINGEDLFTKDYGEYIKEGWIKRNNTEENYKFLIENYLSVPNYHFTEVKDKDYKSKNIFITESGQERKYEEMKVRENYALIKQGSRNHIINECINNGTEVALEFLGRWLDNNIEEGTCGHIEHVLPII